MVQIILIYHSVLLFLCLTSMLYGIVIYFFHYPSLILLLFLVSSIIHPSSLRFSVSVSFLLSFGLTHLLLPVISKLFGVCPTWYSHLYYSRPNHHNLLFSICCLTDLFWPILWCVHSLSCIFLSFWSSLFLPLPFCFLEFVLLPVLVPCSIAWNLFMLPLI